MAIELWPSALHLKVYAGLSVIYCCQTDSQLEQTTSTKLVGNLPMVTRASAVACAVDGRVFPVPVPTS